MNLSLVECEALLNVVSRRWRSFRKCRGTFKMSFTYSLYQGSVRYRLCDSGFLLFMMFNKIDKHVFNEWEVHKKSRCWINVTLLWKQINTINFFTFAFNIILVSKLRSLLQLSICTKQRTFQKSETYFNLQETFQSTQMCSTLSFKNNKTFIRSIHKIGNFVWLKLHQTSCILQCSVINGWTWKSLTFKPQRKENFYYFIHRRRRRLYLLAFWKAPFQREPHVTFKLCPNLYL